MARDDLPPERAGGVASPELQASRGGLATAVADGMFRVDPAPDAVTLGGVEALRFLPSGRSRGIVLHVHGGGFRLGCPEQVGPFAAALAARTGATVICPRYRLAPEHPFPAALNDVQSVWHALRKTGERIVVSGDSAGGGIAAGLAALVGDAAAALVLLSPWLDLTARNASFVVNAASDPLFSATAAEQAASLYLGEGPRDHPLASPGLGRIDHFPPTFVNVGAGEVLLDDARNLHVRLVAAGVATRLAIVPDMDHVAVTRGASLPGAAGTLDAVVAFLHGILGSARSAPGPVRDFALAINRAG